MGWVKSNLEVIEEDKQDPQGARTRSDTEKKNMEEILLKFSGPDDTNEPNEDKVLVI